MGSLLAVTISGLLGNVAVVAGIAAAIGSAVLATVVLGQGRELRRLGDELDAETERAHAAESALAAEVASRPQVPVQPVQPAAVPTTANAVAAVAEVDEDDGPGFTGPEISSGSPALGSATVAPAIAARIALAEEEWEEEGDAEDSEGDVDATSGGLPPASAAGRAAPIVIPSPVPEAEAPAAALGVPATAAAGGIGRTPRPPAQSLRGGSSRRNPWLVALIGVVVAGVLVIGGTQIFGGGGTSSTNAVSTTEAGGGAPAGGKGAIVAVLNATPINGLAGQVSSDLKQAGFRKGRVATAGNQQTQQTVVAYMPGHAVDAEDVVKALKINSNPVAASSAVQAIACPNPASCDAEVIVTVGADLSTR